MNKPKILIVTTSVFTDRMLQYSTFLERLKQEFEVEIWAKSFISNPEDWKMDDILVKSFPKVNPLPHWTSYIRRVNEYAWMNRLDAKSIKINIKYKVKKTFLIKFLLLLGYLFSLLGLHKLLENLVFKLVSVNNRNKKINQDLKQSLPDYLLVFNPFWVEEPIVALEAKKNNIPIISIIPSWDNVTTKSRMVYKSDYYGLWSSVRIKELFTYYPYTKKAKTFVFGTPQYDIFSNAHFLQKKEVFLDQYHLNDSLPILLYTLGSPLFITTEIDVCLQFCKLALQEGILEKYQILIRPHPIKDFSEYIPKFKHIDTRIKIQSEVQTSKTEKNRFMNKAMLENWVSTFYYSDIVIATSSTTLLDASMFNKPHINITENLTEDKQYDDFLKDVSYKFIHLKNLNDQKLLNNITNWEMFFNQLHQYINDKNSIQNKSKEIVIALAEQKNEGKYGAFFANQLIKIVKNNA
ncbi:hypothetical protein GOQ30_00835 [Flavobacterium sp. TP390]|uniref:CDP-Glycerol:Poly(Glycerophosphate) glycerophosphotransferase n=1 Tax=Flavobacterium profundi TaxID=1774945 RepID=A0A6I4IDM5_9FLAO|nr:hypothetical protein [Flavobacterium profundi]MVO07704.1 hypothetical protein [Flavobacterium profundi]